MQIKTEPDWSQYNEYYACCCTIKKYGEVAKKVRNKKSYDK